MRLLIQNILRVVLFIPCMVFANHAVNPDNLAGLHLDWIDKKASPTQNFFAYANGNWQKHHPIPAAYATWGMFHVLDEQNQIVIKKILETAAENSTHTTDPTLQKVGDFYFSGMDIAAINATGITPLQPEFDRIQTIQTLNDLQHTVTHLHQIGVDALFSFGQMQDFKDSNNVIGVASQSGLSLPDRDYYLKNDAKSQQIRHAYIQHVTNMFVLLGDKKTVAANEASTVMTIETALAKASMSRIEQRDPHAIYHIKDLAELQKITPHFSWQNYFSGINHPEIKQINLATPVFFSALDAQLQTVSLANWKIYLRWHLLSSFSAFLSQPFVDEDFTMIKTLTGAKELLPRWKRVLETENGALGFAVGKLYVQDTFSPSSKMATQKIIHDIRAALKKDLTNLAWMTPATRLAAIKKLDMMEDRVGYPDIWRDYSSLNIDRGPYVLNVARTATFLINRDLNKIGKPVDKNEWDMTPQTVNAYYDPSMNRLNIPAGILQPPFFDPTAPAAVNYGAIGFVIGHEMTHGFDDQGAQFDGFGNLHNWWASSDLKKFKTATDSIATQFSQYRVAKNVHVQGKLVMGEAVADLGGLTLAYRAFHATDAYLLAQALGGFTPDQQFFLGAAHVWANNTRPEEARRRAIVDPHPPALFRVNGTLADMPQFQQAFGVNSNDMMHNKAHSTIW